MDSIRDSLEFIPENQFETFQPPSPTDSGPHMTVLYDVRKRNKAHGNYRIVLAAKEVVIVDFPATDLFPFPDMRPYTLEIHLDASDLLFPLNRTSTAWHDFVTELQAGNILVTRDGSEDPADVEFKALIDNLDHVDVSIQATYRWSIDVAKTGNFFLILQGLPAPKDTIADKPSFEADSAPTLCLANLPLRTVTFPSGCHSTGPIPVFCTDDAKQISELQKNWGGCLTKECRRLAWEFILHEFIALPEARDIINHPRDGTVTRPFSPEDAANSGSNRKRSFEPQPNPTAGSSASQGKNSFYLLLHGF